MNVFERLTRFYSGELPLIFGHRGASAHAPMNTIPAFELAVEQGADGIELDVHLAADGELVIVHDFTVDSTTDGSGTVTQMTLQDLKALDAGAWYDPRFAGTRIPTLDEVFESVGDKLLVNVEIKTLSQTADGTEEAVAACIERHAMTDRVLLSSFNPHVIQRCATVMPDVPRAFLIFEGTAQMLGDFALDPTSYQAVHPRHTMIDADLVGQATQRGHIVNTWTVNDVTIARQLVALGVQGIMTDDPLLMREAAL